MLYRLAEMMETRTADLAAVCSGKKEVEAAIDRVVWYAGWADKLAQVIGSSNPVSGPYFNFSVPEPTGVVAVLAPDEPALDGLVARLAPVIVGGNAAVVVASETHPLAAIELAEAIATSDLPGGIVNILTGLSEELAPILAGHMDVNAIDVTGADGQGPSSSGLPRTTSSEWCTEPRTSRARGRSRASSSSRPSGIRSVSRRVSGKARTPAESKIPEGGSLRSRGLAHAGWRPYPRAA